MGGSGQDGGRVRRGDHLPPHSYIRNTSTCGTAPIEHPLNAGRRCQTSQKARNSPRTWVGQKKKEITETTWHYVVKNHLYFAILYLTHKVICNIHTYHLIINI